MQRLKEENAKYKERIKRKSRETSDEDDDEKRASTATTLSGSPRGRESRLASPQKRGRSSSRKVAKMYAGTDHDANAQSARRGLRLSQDDHGRAIVVHDDEKEQRDSPPLQIKKEQGLERQESAVDVVAELVCDKGDEDERTLQRTESLAITEHEASQVSDAVMASQ